MLLFYGLLLGVLLPYTVGKWWYGTQALTKDKVLIASAGKLFKEYKEDISEGGMIAALSTGDEYKEVLKGSGAENGAAKIEKIVLAESSLSDADRLAVKQIDDPLRRKTLSLLWAHLCRVRLDDVSLNKEKVEVAPLAVRLNNSMTSMALALGVVAPLTASYHTSQNLIQAVPPNASPMLQLPHFTPKIVESIQGPHSKERLTIQKFMSLPAQIRRSLASDLSDSEYAKAMQVASVLPHLRVAKAFFKVMGERVVTPSSLVQLVIKARFIPPGSKGIPEIDELDLEDVDPDEDDLEGLIGRKPPKNRKKKNIDGQVIEEDPNKPVQPSLVFAPYYARDHSPRWHVFLADARQGRIAVPPFTFSAFDRPIIDSEGRPTYNMQTFKCQFQAPPQVGQFPFVMHLICDSYIGFDTKIDVVLDVQDVSKAVQVESEDEISEADEGRHYKRSRFPRFLTNVFQIPLPGRCKRSKAARHHQERPGNKSKKSQMKMRATPTVKLGKIPVRRTQRQMKTEQRVNYREQACCSLWNCCLLASNFCILACTGETEWEHYGVTGNENRANTGVQRIDNGQRLPHLHNRITWLRS